MRVGGLTIVSTLKVGCTINYQVIFTMVIIRMVRETEGADNSRRLNRKFTMEIGLMIVSKARDLLSTKRELFVVGTSERTTWKASLLTRRH